MVTQFVFEARPIIDWIERVRNEGNRLPLVVGVPGPASLKSLIGHATNCGVGPSIKFLTKQARNVHKLLMLQTPDKLVRGWNLATLSAESGVPISTISRVELGQNALNYEKLSLCDRYSRVRGVPAASISTTWPPPRSNGQVWTRSGVSIVSSDGCWVVDAHVTLTASAPTETALRRLV